MRECVVFSKLTDKNRGSGSGKITSLPFKDLQTLTLALTTFLADGNECEEQYISMSPIYATVGSTTIELLTERDIDYVLRRGTGEIKIAVSCGKGSLSDISVRFST